MKFTTKIKLGLVVAAAVAIVGAPSAALATEEATTRVQWVAPAGSTLENVGYPQTLATGTECSTPSNPVVIQDDEYLASEAPKFTADGVLNRGEDYQNDGQRGVISWKVYLAPECAQPPQPEPALTVTSSSQRCDETVGKIVKTETVTTTPFVWDEASWSWVPDTANATTEDVTTQHEDANCIVKSDPDPEVYVPTPPAPGETATPAPLPADTEPSARQGLAVTGPNDAALIWAGGIALAVGVALLLIRRLRRA